MSVILTTIIALMDDDGVTIEDIVQSSSDYYANERDAINIIPEDAVILKEGIYRDFDLVEDSARAYWMWIVTRLA